MISASRQGTNLHVQEFNSIAEKTLNHFFIPKLLQNMFLLLYQFILLQLNADRLMHKKTFIKTIH